MPQPPINFRLTGKWVELGNKLDPLKFQRALDPELGKALDLAGFEMRKIIRARLRGGKFKWNKPLTIAIKKSSKPLIDRGDMFAAVTHVLNKTTNREVFIGILHTAQNRSGKRISNIAETLHEGERIPVTPRMRRLFFYLALASEGTISPSTLTGRAAELFARNQDWRPLRPTTTHIVIPGRPFITRAFANKAFHVRFKKEILKATKRAFMKIK